MSLSLSFQSSLTSLVLALLSLSPLSSQLSPSLSVQLSLSLFSVSFFLRFLFWSEMAHVMCLFCACLCVSLWLYCAVLCWSGAVVVVVCVCVFLCLWVLFIFFVFAEKTRCVQTKRSRVCRQNGRVSHDTCCASVEPLGMKWDGKKSFSHVKECCRSTGSVGVVRGVASVCKCCAVLCCAVLCCAVLCCAVLCCAVLCCAVLCSVCSCVMDCNLCVVGYVTVVCFYKKSEMSRLCWIQKNDICDRT